MQCMHDMAKHDRCNLAKLNGTVIPTFNYKVQVIFLNIKIKCWFNKEEQGMGELIKIIWNRDIN